MRRWLFPVALLAGLSPSVAVAQGDNCAVFKDVEKKWTDAGMYPAVRAVLSENKIMMVYVDLAGDWLQITVNTAGVACLIGAGEGFQAIKPPVPGKDS